MLLATDLDRTLIPNGEQPESPGARQHFTEFVARPEVTLAYVTGRHRQLVEDAMAEWQLPQPDYVIGDVGTSIYRVNAQTWESLPEWHAHIGRDWQGVSREVLAGLFADMAGLELQEAEKQGVFKLSYYAPHDMDVDGLKVQMQQRLAAEDIKAQLIWSLDETGPVGLLDVLPGAADKLQALRFLIGRLGIAEQRVVFSGDSGNDLPILTSGIQAVLVANAHDTVRKALAAGGAGSSGSLYLARGGFAGMNGCYAAGILEGVAHFLPDMFS